MSQENMNEFEFACVLFIEMSVLIWLLYSSYARESNKLIDLPDDYSCLINQASSFS